MPTVALFLPAELPEVCREVFTRRPCLGIWHPSTHLSDESLCGLAFKDSPVARHVALDCEEWVDGDGVEDRVPAMCVKCKKIVAAAEARSAALRRSNEKEEDEVIKVKQEVSQITSASQLDLSDNSPKLESEGGGEDEPLDADDAMGSASAIDRDEVCEDAFDEYDDYGEEFKPDNIYEEEDENILESIVEKDEGVDSADNRYV